MIITVTTEFGAKYKWDPREGTVTRISKWDGEPLTWTNVHHVYKATVGEEWEFEGDIENPADAYWLTTKVQLITIEADGVIVSVPSQDVLTISKAVPV